MELLEEVMTEEGKVGATVSKQKFAVQGGHLPDYKFDKLPPLEGSHYKSPLPSTTRVQIPSKPPIPFTPKPVAKKCPIPSTPMPVSKKPPIPFTKKPVPETTPTQFEAPPSLPTTPPQLSDRRSGQVQMLLSMFLSLFLFSLWVYWKQRKDR